MPDMVEQMYCSQQIAVPAMFPYILKQYAKAAIRTQPYDLLRWSAAYFSAMANGETPPVKYRIEYPAPETESGLTPGYLRVLLKQLGVSGQVPVHVLYDKWLGVCLNENCLRDMLAIGGFRDMVDWLHFVAVAAAHLTDSLAMTMCLCCELLTEEPEGGSAMIPCDTFLDIYNFLARLECGPPREPSVEAVVGSEPVFEPIVPISDDDVGTIGSQAHLQEEVQGERSVPGSPKESESVPGEVGDPAMGNLASSKEHEFDGEGNFEDVQVCVDIPSETRQMSPTEEVAAVTAPRESSLDAKKSLSGDRAKAESAGSLGVVEGLDDQEGDDPSELAGEDDGDEFGDEEVVKMSEGSVIAPKSECSAGEESRGESQDQPQDESVQTVPIVRHVPGIGPAVKGEQIERVELYMRSWADRQEGMVMPRNIRHFLCPPLDSLLVQREFQVDSSQDVNDQSYLYPQRRPITCQDVVKE